MAKSNRQAKPKPAAKPAAAAPEATAKPRRREVVTVVLRKPRTIGDAELELGQVIGEVELEPGVSLNYLVDAVRNGLAGPLKE